MLQSWISAFRAVFYAVSAVLFGYAIDRFGTKIIIPCFIFLSLLDMLIVILVPEKARINRSTSVSKPLSTGMAFKTILKNRQYIAILICYLLIEMSNTPMQNYLARKFEVLGAGDIYTGLSFLVEPVASGLYIGAVIQYMKDILPANVQYLGLSFYSAFTTGVAGLAGNYIAGLLSDNMGVLAMMKLTTIPSIMGFLFFVVTSIVFMHKRKA